MGHAGLPVIRVRGGFGMLSLDNLCGCKKGQLNGAEKLIMLLPVF